MKNRLTLLSFYAWIFGALFISTNVLAQDEMPIQLCQITASQAQAQDSAGKLKDTILTKANQASVRLEYSEACSVKEPHKAGHSVGILLDRSAATGNLALYAAFFHKENARLADAITINDEAYEGASEGLDLKDLRGDDAKRIEMFANRIMLRLRANQSFANKAVNIQEAVFGSRFVKLVPEIRNYIAASDADSKKGSDEAFKIISEYAVTVASNVVTDAKKQPVTITVISREKIAMSGARNLTQVLNTYVPGYFTIEDQDDVIAGFRGLAPDNNAKVLLLIDGHNLNTEWFWGPPDALLHSFDLNFIERIEIIRGPGSVTLGQGALLGVVNVITKGGQYKNGINLSGGVGADMYTRTSVYGGRTGAYLDKLNAFGYMSLLTYGGQPLRREAYAIDKKYEGSEISTSNVVADTNLRLNRAKNSTLMGKVQYDKDHELLVMNTNQRRDSYNFYRDRAMFENSVFWVGTRHNIPINDKMTIRMKNNFANDDLTLLSPQTVVNGGTREMRFGTNILLAIDDLIKDNKLAVGIEFRHYRMGLRNANGDNFIANKSSSRFDTGNNPVDRNIKNVYIFPFNINVMSVFAEDFYSINRYVDVFAAVRYDNHTGWGNNISPRAGFLFDFGFFGRYRVNYHEGFRGAVGQSYAGGWLGDGFLRVQNFQYIQAANIPKDGGGTYANVPETKPEKMRSVEVAATWETTIGLDFSLAGFYSQLENTLDVGVIYVDAGVFTVPPLGTDTPGDWNGYWFYKNNEGIIEQSGLEAEINYKSKYVQVGASHALVAIVKAPDAQLGSMYITKGKKFRAYPENVTRAQLWLYPIDQVTLQFNYMYYYHWVSPNDKSIPSANLVNTAIEYRPTREATMRLSVRNLLDERTAYPMNANAGGKDLSDGSPSIETRTWWLEFEYMLL